MESEIESPAPDGRSSIRVQAVLALLRGEPAAQVSAQFDICRSDLYKFRKRALDAMRDALRDEKKGPKTPHNRLDVQKEGAIRSVCERRPTLSSYEVRDRLQADAPSARTIQRVRNRLDLPRLNKRDTPSFEAHRFNRDERQLIRNTVESKLYLGPYRLAWDLRNQHELKIGPSTTRRVKRAILDERNPRSAPAVWRFYERKHPHSLWHGDLMEKVTLTDEDQTAYQLTLQDDYSRAYVFCDLYREPTVNTTIGAMISAMRVYQTIPKAVVFDNGPTFSGRLLSAFCLNLDIRLIYTSVRHPQTNGKLERAFRDDMNEFYRKRERWIFGELRRNLPEYVHYRNHIRGHLALGGKPSITRLQERDWFALPSVLGQLEEYACYRIGKRMLDEVGGLRVLGRTAIVDYRLRGQEITLYENLKGLLAVSEEGRCCVLRSYRKMYCGHWGNFPHHNPHFRLYFSRLSKHQCPKLLSVLAATSDESFNHKSLPLARRKSPRIAVAQ